VGCTSDVFGVLVINSALVRAGDIMDVAANVAALIHVAHKLYNYGHDVIKAKEEQATILHSLQAIQLLLEQIETREADARKNPNDTWYQGLLALCTSATTASSGKALVPDPTRRGAGALVRLRNAFKLLEDQLEPKHGWAGTKQRLLWTYDKKKIKETVTEIDQLRSHVDSILQQDHFQLSRAILDLVSQNASNTHQLIKTGLETNDRVQSLKATGADAAKQLQELQFKTSEIGTNVQEVRITTDDTNARIARLELESIRRTQREERRAIIEWLSPLQYRRRQSEIFNEAIPLGQKFIESEEFRAWSLGRPWILYGYGLPGSGKTILTSIVVDQLQKRFAAQKIPVICMFLNYKEQHQTLTKLVGSLLKQLIQFGDDDLRSPEVRRLFRDAASEAPPLLDDLCKALQAEIVTFQRVILVIDALDEASESLRFDLRDKIGTIRSHSMDKLSVMITSRPRDDIPSFSLQCHECKKNPLKISYNCEICNDGDFDLCQKCVDKGIHCYERSHQLIGPLEVAIDIEPTDEEIKRYVEYEITKELGRGKVHARDRRFVSSTMGSTRLARNIRDAPELRTMIPEHILASCNGMFMLAKLFMGAVKSKTSPDEVRTALETLPGGYDESYQETMERIESASISDPNDPSGNLAKRALMWVACSYRPLSLAELQEALAIDLQKPDYVTSHKHDKNFLLEITAGLLYVDSDERNVSLCHNTAQEYFTKSRDSWFPNFASQLARSCLQYLGRSDFASPCEGIREDEEFEKRRKRNPFSAYAYLFWGNHAHDASEDDPAQEAAIRFLGDTGRVDAFVQAAWLLDSAGLENWDQRKGINSLHVAAWFGLSNLIPRILEQGLDVDSEDRSDQTPLMFACRRGHPQTVAALLDRGASVNLRSQSESTALFEAVRNNHLEALTVLLGDPKLKVNAPHWREAERTALMFAAKDDDVAILTKLVDDVRIDVNKQDLYGTTALMIAAKNGSSEAVLYLLEHDNINVNATDQTGSTALIHAAKWNHSEIVDQLLASGAIPAAKDQNGGTALLRAIDEGYTDVVKSMLEYPGVDISTTDTYRRTFLHGAAVNGHTEIVQLLLDRGLDKDCQDDCGRTPLHEACRNGKAEVVNLLSASGARGSIKDKWHRTAADVAWLHGQARIILVLDGKPSDPSSVEAMLGNYPDLKALPIWSLANIGHVQELTAAIRERPGDLTHLDPDTDNAAVHAATLANRPPIVTILLQAGLSPDSQNAQSRTPLHLAVLYGYHDCTKAILAHSPDLNIRDEFHQTPLLIAQIKAYFEIALLLIEARAYIDPNMIQIQAFFFQAIELARPKALQILIDNGANVAEKNKVGKTALRVAKDMAGESEEDGVAEKMGEIIQILQVNKSRFVKVDGALDEEQEEEEEEEKEAHRFQMSAFRRKDVWEQKEEKKTTTALNLSPPPLRGGVPA
ncbi:MAG: hypothetical protein Q9228_007000, partial [Teloschistes exilis]